MRLTRRAVLLMLTMVGWRWMKTEMESFQTMRAVACVRILSKCMNMKWKNGKEFSPYSLQVRSWSSVQRWRCTGFECHFISNVFMAHKIHSFQFCSLFLSNAVALALRFFEYFYSIDRMLVDRSTWHFCAFCGNLITIHYQLSQYHQVFTCATNTNVIWYFQEDFFSLLFSHSVLLFDASLPLWLCNLASVVICCVTQYGAEQRNQ